MSDAVLVPFVNTIISRMAKQFLHYDLFQLYTWVIRVQRTENLMKSDQVRSLISPFSIKKSHPFRAHRCSFDTIVAFVIF